MAKQMTVMFLRADACHATSDCHITMRKQLSGPSQQTTVMLPRAEGCYACVKLRSVNNCHVTMSKRLPCYYEQTTAVLL